MRAGIDLMNMAYNYLELTPNGGDEGGRGQFWVGATTSTRIEDSGRNPQIIPARSLRTHGREGRQRAWIRHLQHR